MPIDKRWERLTRSEWVAFAQSWLEEVRSDLPIGQRSVGQAVVHMDFTSTGDQKWQFILPAVRLAESDVELEYIAAGPVEHLLARHGDKYIEKVERRAASDPKFARMMTQVRKYLMADDVWRRVERIQKLNGPNSNRSPDV